MKRIVKLIATNDPRYKETPYPYRCILDENINTYLTGQHIDPNDPETYDNLTLEEMTGQERLSPEKKKRFPFVIDPLKRINFRNLETFDLSTDAKGKFINPKDAAMINLLRKYCWFVADSKAQVQNRKHYFYIHDEIFEAEARVVNSDKVYEAQKFVREELASDGLFDVALVLSYKLKEFTFNPKDYNPIVLKDKILQVCETKPETILECKADAFKNDIFILKLAYHEVITRRGTDFYDGSTFIGKDLLDVQKFIKLEENVMTVSKWGRMLAQKEGRISKDGGAEPSNKKEELYSELEGKNLEELRKFAGSKRYAKVEWGHIENPDDLIQYLISKAA